jgi:site-specific DNA recombinase
MLHNSIPLTSRRSVAPARAAIYARVSSERQAEQHTIDSQVTALLARAAADGREIGAEFRFIDEGHSGASLIRPALERLRDLIAMAVIDTVYVHAPDRLARNYVHQAVLIEEFARAGTEIVFLNRPISSSPEDTLLLQLQGMFAEYERARMLERSRRGKRHLAQAGVVSVLSRAPYGYRFIGRDTGDGVARFEVMDEKAEVVRRIFHWVGRDHVTLSGACQRLFDAGVPSPNGNARWSRSMVGVLLSNSAYAGQAIFGKNASIPWTPPLRPARGRASVPKRPFRQISAPLEHRIAIPVPALIEADLFESAQEQLAENRRRNRQRLAGVQYLLQGLVVCSKCGYAFCGRRCPRYPRDRDHEDHYYRCCGTESNRLYGQRRCDARVVRVAPLDAAVWAEVCRVLEDPARVLEEYQRRLDVARTSPQQADLEALDRRLTKLRGGIGRLIDSYAEGIIDKAEFEPRIAELRQRVAQLEGQAAMLTTAAEQTRSLHLVIGKLETFATLIGDRLETADWETRRDIIRTLVRRIEIDDDTVRVIFRIDPGPNDSGGSRRLLQHCPQRDRAVALRHRRRRAGGNPAESGTAPDHAIRRTALPVLPDPGWTTTGAQWGRDRPVQRRVSSVPSPKPQARGIRVPGVPRPTGCELMRPSAGIRINGLEPRLRQCGRRRR